MIDAVDKSGYTFLDIVYKIMPSIPSYLICINMIEGKWDMIYCVKSAIAFIKSC